jgi:hypothetical protein
MARWARLTVAVVAACLAVCDGADKTQPHPHKGVLKAYVNGPMNIDLSAADKRSACARAPGACASRQAPSAAVR